MYIPHRVMRFSGDLIFSTGDVDSVHAPPYCMYISVYVVLIEPDMVCKGIYLGGSLWLLGPGRVLTIYTARTHCKYPPRNTYYTSGYSDLRAPEAKSIRD